MDITSSSPTSGLLHQEDRRPTLLRYGMAVLIVSLCVAIRLLLQPVFGHDVPYLVFFPAIMLAGWYGGLGPGLLATALSAVAVEYLFIAPLYTLGITSKTGILRLLLFVGVGAFMSGLNEMLIRARLRSERSAVESLAREQALRQAQRDARESELRFRIMADSAPVLVWMAGIDKECDWFNRPWLEFTGRTMEQEVGNGWVEGVHPDDRERCWNIYSTSFDARREFSMEYRLRRHDGEYRWLLDNGVPRYGDGKFQGFIGTCIDIHDRKQAEDLRARALEDARRAWREAENASRSKDEFLATVSHELRTPLNAMLGWAQLLQLALEDQAKLNRGLEVIARSARAQSQLIDDLLDVSRIISGKMRLNVRSVDLLPVIGAAVEAVRPAAEAKQIQIRQLLDPLAGPVAGDSDRLQQVVWNLLANAVKFTPRGGKVEVRLERINSHVDIIVADTGAGISPEFLPLVFERFRQFDSSTTRTQGGLGLGLAIVRHLAELHGGTVRVESPGAGEGATFVVSLPLAVARLDPVEEERVHPFLDPQERRATCADDPALNLDGIRVLVVDDEPDARETLAQILEHCDAEVLAVGSADEALRELERFRPHVLLSDIGMPGEDGYSLIRRVRALPPERGGRIPAAALTAFARGEDRRRALLAGFQMHVAKPVDIHDLAAVVAALARGTGDGDVSGPNPPSPPG